MLKSSIHQARKIVRRLRGVMTCSNFNRPPLFATSLYTEVDAKIFPDAQKRWRFGTSKASLTYRRH